MPKSCPSFEQFCIDHAGAIGDLLQRDAHQTYRDVRVWLSPVENVTIGGDVALCHFGIARQFAFGLVSVSAYWTARGWAIAA